MKKYITFIAFIAALVSANAAEPQYFKLDLGSFDELKVIGGVNVDYRTSTESEGYAEFIIDPELANMLMFKVKKNHLVIELAEDYNPSTMPLPTISVYSRTLKRVENSGDSLIRVYEPLCGDKFLAKVIGNGRLAVHGVKASDVKGQIVTGHGQVILSGSCQLASLSTTGGSATIQADELHATDVSCRIIGTGTIGCNVNGKLSIYGTGSGKIYYSGSPTEIVSRSLGINAYPLD